MTQSTFPALVPGPAAMHVSRCGPGPSPDTWPGGIQPGLAVNTTAALPQQAPHLVSVEGITPFLPKSSLPENN